MSAVERLSAPTLRQCETVAFGAACADAILTRIMVGAGPAVEIGPGAAMLQDISWPVWAVTYLLAVAVNFLCIRFTAWRGGGRWSTLAAVWSASVLVANAMWGILLAVTAGMPHVPLADLSIFAAAVYVALAVAIYTADTPRRVGVKP